MNSHCAKRLWIYDKVIYQGKLKGEVVGFMANAVNIRWENDNLSVINFDGDSRLNDIELVNKGE